MIVSTPSIIIGKRYRLEDKLGTGGMGTVYRAFDRLTGDAVALKRVTTAADQSVLASFADSSDLRVVLAQEFQFLAALRHPNIISVLDYGFDADRQPFFTMEILENAQTILDAGRDQPIPVQIGLLGQMLQALTYLHRREIIHRDLKPGNVLVTDGRVSVLDFGLSSHTSKATNSAGTLAYMAPEIVRGSSASVASDLYAVGIIAYEMFAGRHPFQTDSIRMLIDQILNEQPNLFKLSLDKPLLTVLDRLLAKEPEQRYANAQDVIQAFNAAVGPIIPLETKATRESFLQSAPLTGRDAQITQLTEALAKIGAQGSAWLIGGESGIGKSRLLDELRTKALVSGVSVIRGQALSDGSNAYQVWLNIVRWLVLLTEINDQEASVLKGLVPDIASLLERPILDASPLDPRSAKLRLFSVIADVVSRLPQKTLIMLEDLHWARPENLELLNWLNQRIARYPLMLLGSFRDDETPALPSQLPGMKLLKLEPLSVDNIAQISEAMLGAAASQKPVVDLLTRETEGNVFFLVEVVRTLAEEVGSLGKIGTDTLPVHLLVGGVQQLLARRLKRVPVEARPLLEFAAVAGRQLDLSALEAALTSLKINMDIEQFLTICANVAVLDRQDGRWRFAHDKLRERLLADMSAEKQRQLHQQVATAIEKAYADPSSQAAALTEHWAAAGDADKERHYAEITGRQALQNGANQEAIKYLSRALELGAADNTPSDSADALNRAAMERLIGEAYLGLGRLTDSLQHLQQTIKVLGWHVPTNRSETIRTLLSQSARQFVHRALGDRFPRRPATNNARIAEAVQAYQRIADINYYMNNSLATVSAGVYTLNLAESAAPSVGLARSYPGMAVVCGLIPLHGLAKTYIARTAAAIRNIDDPGALAFILGRMSVYLSGIGEWKKVHEYLEKSIILARQVGDHRQWGESSAILGLVEYMEGRLTACRDRFNEIYHEALRTSDKRNEMRGLYWQAQALLRLGQPEQIDEAAHLLQQSLDTLAKTPTTDHDWSTMSNGLMALACLYRGEYGRIETLLDKVKSDSVTSFALFEGYASMGEVGLTLWETGYKPDTAARYVETACAVLKKFARVFTIGQPRYLVYIGLRDWLQHKPDQALQFWKKAIDLAAAMDMPLEEGLARYELGRHLPPENPERQLHLNGAAALFRSSGAALYLKRVEAALELMPETV